MLIKAGEASLTLRVLDVDNSVIAAFGQQGRQPLTRMVHPMSNASGGVALVWYHPTDTRCPPCGGVAQPQRVSVTAWETHDALDNAPAHK